MSARERGTGGPASLGRGRRDRPKCVAVLESLVGELLKPARTADTYKTRTLDRRRQSIVLFFRYLGLAERVGFGLRPRVENKELSGIPLPPDPLEPLKRRGRRT